MDYGLDYRKAEGLFSKTDSRKGTGLSWPLDLKPVAEIRRGRIRRRPAASWMAAPWSE
jgi:hypothetical protein